MSAPGPNRPNPSGPAAAPPAPPGDPLGRDRERDRLLTLANVHRMRGQTRLAQETLQQALALSGDTPPTRTDAPVYELLGDLLAADGKDSEARDAFDTAHKLDPGRASAERKLAQMVLRIADADREKALAEAILRGEAPAVVDPLAPAAVKRSPVLAFLLSSVLPGVGQMYNGQIVKGIICAAVFLPALLALIYAPGASGFFEQVLPVLGGGTPRAGGQVSPGLLLLMFLAAVIWMYAVIDAPMVASKHNKTGGGPGAPNIDKTGWEV